MYAVRGARFPRGSCACCLCDMSDAAKNLMTEEAVKSAAAALNLRPEDVASLMSQVTALASEKRLLEDKLKENSVIVERFQEQERAEMKRKLDEVIKQWVDENDWTDPELKKKVLDGMQEMVQHNKKDSPIWNMVCCASETHKKNVTELNRITTEYNTLRSKVEGGSFRNEASRVVAGGDASSSGMKRKAEEAMGMSSYSAGGGSSSGAGGAGGASVGPSSIWDDFAASIHGGSSSINHFVPEPEVLRGLRSEWRPLGEAM